MATRRKFTLEFKTEEARRVIDSGRSVVEVAKEIAVPDDDHRNSPLSITEIPQVSAVAGWCCDYRISGWRTPFLIASERARWLRMRLLSPSILKTTLWCNSRSSMAAAIIGSSKI